MMIYADTTRRASDAIEHLYRRYDEGMADLDKTTSESVERSIMGMQRNILDAIRHLEGALVNVDVGVSVQIEWALRKAGQTE